MGKLEEIRALGQTEIFRRFGAVSARKPLPEVPGVTKGFVNEPPHPLDRPAKSNKESNKSNAESNSVADKSGTDSFDKKAYQREYMRARRAAKPKP